MLESTGDKCQCVRELAKLVSSLRGCRAYAKLKVQEPPSFTVRSLANNTSFSKLIQKAVAGRRKIYENHVVPLALLASVRETINSNYGRLFLIHRFINYSSTKKYSLVFYPVLTATSCAFYLSHDHGHSSHKSLALQHLFASSSQSARECLLAPDLESLIYFLFLGYS